MAASKPTAPQYLSAEAKKIFNSVVGAYELEKHHIVILVTACASWDRWQQARRKLDRAGTTYEAKGRYYSRPEVAVERDSKATFLRALRELGLDRTSFAELEGRGNVLPINAGRRRAGGW
jgi:P27 family predicted phage terminase small subunit